MIARATSLPSESPASERVSGVFPRASRPSVLVVDPDQDARAALVAALSSHFDVHEARDGATALSMVAALRPTLVITELALAGLDGLSLARTIKSRPALQRTTIVFLSAESAPRTIAQAVAVGARRHIVKPCAPSTVAGIAQRIVGP
jgi:PleD family two-component response regulator